MTQPLPFRVILNEDSPDSVPHYDREPIHGRMQKAIIRLTSVPVQKHPRAVLIMKIQASLLFLTCIHASGAIALESLNDEVLSTVSGQDGLTFDIETSATGLSLDTIEIELDPGVANYETSLLMSASPDGSAAGLPISLLNVNENGVAGGSAHAIHTLDVGSSGGGDAYLSYQLEIYGQDDADGNRRARLALGEWSHGGSKTYGSSVLDGEGFLHLINKDGFFNVEATDAYMLGELNNGRIFYRQLAGDHADRSYLIMDNLNARWEMGSGTFGINPEGIVMKTPDTIDVALDFDMYHKTGGADFTPGGRGLMHFGWLGSLKDPELLWRLKGSAGALTPGVLNLSSRWNFVGADDPIAISDPSKEFRWRLGETGGTASPVNGDTRVQFELADWETWGGHAYGHNFPLIALDVISGNRLGDMSLCWGGSNTGACTAQTVNLTPGFLGTVGNNEGLAVYTRDGSFQTYSRKINVIEEVWNTGSNSYEMQLLNPGDNYYSPNVSRTVDWGLIYTFANIDGNILIHPGGNPDDTDKGMTIDLMLMSQTFDESDPTVQGFNWDNGSHLMIADTNMDQDALVGETRDAMGIGLMSTSFLIMADDTRLWLKPQIGADYYTGGIDLFSPRARFAINTTFGGGVLPDNLGGYGTGARFVKGSIITANLEGALNMRLSPSDPASTDGQNYLGYSGAIRLISRADDAGAQGFGASSNGSHISLAEPSRPDVAFRLANMSGDIAMINGKVDVRPGDEDGDNKPKIVISHNILLGNAAAARMAEVQGIPASSAPEFRIDSLKLGDATLGRVVMPSARIYSSITLQPQY
jgi:hypothetical protein